MSLNQIQAQKGKLLRNFIESNYYFQSKLSAALKIAIIDLKGKWVKVSPALCDIFGYQEEDLISTNFQAISHSEDLQQELSYMDQLIAGSISSYQVEKRYLHQQGHHLWILQNATLIRDAQNNPHHIILQIQDISDRKEAERKIYYAAFHDHLTGLPNRVLFSNKLSEAIERSKKVKNYEFAVVFVDLDRFKIVNDSLGHEMGDELLVGLSMRLERCLRSTDTIARLSGDEFAILLDGISASKDATDIAERIHNCLKEPFDLNGHNFYTSASIGIAYSRIGYDKSEDILRDADTAMYRAKANGKARHEIFDSKMHTQAVNALMIESELRTAINGNELMPFYQPIVSLKTGKIVGFEALARWLHPERNLISPSVFIPVAEETGLIIPIGMKILEQSCREACKWQKAFPNDRPLTVSVNVSSKQFLQSNLVREITDILIRTGIQPSSLRLEVTESLLMADTLSTTEMLRELKLIGVQISIDDFGTGYSSLSYLHRLPFDILKIDRSFVNNMCVDKESLGIVKTIITLAKELGKSIVAEGIETEEHVAMLSNLSCDYGQGFYYSKPVNSHDVNRLLKKQWQEKIQSNEFDCSQDLSNVSLVEVPGSM
ncbi:MAG TPA: EAL domain-containing protein [Pyrinomonadaceae bacterium]|jgi:diguanylate cyclase (GGDEF)-like protein/PAS domain S-box-containing protein